MITEMNDGTRGFRPPSAMTPREIGDQLARLVWESFSDFITEGDAEALLGRLGLTNPRGVPADATAEELLIFIMWAHTRGLQLAFVGKQPDERVKKALDAFHTAVYEDMVTHGTPRDQVPIFEQRVGARYAEYHQAAARSDAELGAAAVRAITDGGNASEPLALALAERAIAVANPLRDFLEEVKLAE